MKKIRLEMYLTKNLGDDIFLHVITQRYEDVRFDVTVKNSYLDSFNFGNVHGRSLLRRVIDKIKRKILRVSTEGKNKYIAKLVLGGSMFIELGKSEGELKNELKEKYGGGLPLFVLGANFGPYRNQYYFDEYKKLFARAEDVCFRDKYSAGLFKDLKNVRVAPDIIFGLDATKYVTKQEKKVVISVIDLEKREALGKHLGDYEKKISEITTWYAEHGYEVVLMSFCKFEGDENAINRIMRNVSNNKIKAYYYNGDIESALKQIASSEIVIGTRFHSVILGMVFGKKVLPIIYSNKTKNTLADVKFNGEMVGVDEMSRLRVSSINSYLTKYEGVDKLRNKAEAHFEKLDKFLKESR